MSSVDPLNPFPKVARDAWEEVVADDPAAAPVRTARREAASGIGLDLLYSARNSAADVDSGAAASPGAGVRGSHDIGAAASPGAGVRDGRDAGAGSSPGAGVRDNRDAGAAASPGAGVRDSRDVGAAASPGAEVRDSHGTGAATSPGAGVGSVSAPRHRTRTCSDVYWMGPAATDARIREELAGGADAIRISIGSTGPAQWLAVLRPLVESGVAICLDGTTGDTHAPSGGENAADGTYVRFEDWIALATALTAEHAGGDAASLHAAPLHAASLHAASEARIDPFAHAVQSGASSAEVRRRLDTLSRFIRGHAQSPVGAIGVSTIPYHDAGADEALEIGIAIATAAAYLRAILEPALTEAMTMTPRMPQRHGSSPRL
ncbi:MAG: methylmalonyl-CoA mutase family protein [Candidatus Eisenbacteria bacterium]